METMERQLAGLSSLVHSALVSKGMNERTQKDMAHLRKEILALHADSREFSEEPASLPESISSHTHHQLHDLSGQVQQAKNDVRQLKRMAQVWQIRNFTHRDIRSMHRRLGVCCVKLGIRLLE